MKKLVLVLIALVGMVSGAFAKTPFTVSSACLYDLDDFGGEIALSADLITNDFNTSTPGLLIGAMFTKFAYDFVGDSHNISLSLGYGVCNLLYASVEVEAGIYYTFGKDIPSVVFGWKCGKPIFTSCCEVYAGSKYVLNNGSWKTVMALGVSAKI